MNIPVITQFSSSSLVNKRVFLRADLNVPCKHGTIVDDYRLLRSLPTIDFLHQCKAKIILATHLDRPHGIDQEFSTRILLPWFEQRGYVIEHVSTIGEAYTKSLHDSATILLLENLRFNKGEVEGSVHFARQLAALADYYVNDAFGALHRNDTSIALLPMLFKKNRRAFGILVEQEFDALSNIKYNPMRPFMVIMGGVKGQEKLPALLAMIDHVDVVALCPALSFAFMQTENCPIGSSLLLDIDPTLLHKFKEKAKRNNTKILLPTDYVVAHGSLEGNLSIIKSNEFTQAMIGITIGPETAKQYAKEIKKASTIFCNGAPGFFERNETLEPFGNLIKAINSSKTFAVISGGDTIAAVRLLNMEHNNSFLSTGGGSTLSWLSNQPLPGLLAFNERDKNLINEDC